MSVEHNKTVAERIVRDDASAPLVTVVSAVAPMATTDLGSALIGELINRAFDDIEVVPEDIIGDRDLVLCRSSWSGRHHAEFAGIPATGRRVSGQRVDLFWFDDGHITRSRQCWDLFSIVRALRGALPEPLLDVAEIQGNIVPGFNKDHQHLLFCRIVDVAGLRQWLGRLLPHIATLEETMQFKRLFAATRRRRGYQEGTLKSSWINIAFSSQGLRKLISDADVPTDPAFRQGMAARASLLGDQNPDVWVVGSPQDPPDLVVIAAADDPDDLSRSLAMVERDAAGALQILWSERGDTLPPPETGHEYFGFSDGISQPGVRGRLSERIDDLLTPRENLANWDQGKPGQALCQPGEFVLGYPTEPGSAANAVLAEPEWSRNGSYLVYRRYRQDIGEFNSFLNSTSKMLATRYPALADLTPNKLGAMLMGRWRSGAPLLTAPMHDDPALGTDKYANNDFEFSGDPDGLICPFAAHIRKTNPRDDAGPSASTVNSHRILRRGIPYHDDKTDEHGLHFLCYQTSIERQFEFILRHWANNPDFRRIGEGCDPFIGQIAFGKRRLTIPVRDATGASMPVSLEIPVSWITPTGGAYFFAPAIGALQTIVNAT